ncbi:MAG: hypothetical protein IKN88_09025 [Bacteroidales bacterium]|nr:hypothetical protein [Bacteroidales bacterium]
MKDSYPAIPSELLLSRNTEIGVVLYSSPEFLGDSDILLRVGAEPFDPIAAYTLVKEQFIEKMPGKRE